MFAEVRIFFVGLFSLLNGQVGESPKVLIYPLTTVRLSHCAVFHHKARPNCSAWQWYLCGIDTFSPRFNSGLVFGIVAMLGSVVLLVKTLQQTLAQMTTDNPRMGGQQTLQVVVRTHRTGHLWACIRNSHQGGITQIQDDFSPSFSVLDNIKVCFRLLRWDKSSIHLNNPLNQFKVLCILLLHRVGD